MLSRERSGVVKHKASRSVAVQAVVRANGLLAHHSAHHFQQPVLDGFSPGRLW